MGTIAVLAGALDTPSQPQNVRLCAEIAATGAVVSTHPPGGVARARLPAPQPHHIGSVAAIVVVETAERASP